MQLIMYWYAIVNKLCAGTLKTYNTADIKLIYNTHFPPMSSRQLGIILIIN